MQLPDLRNTLIALDGHETRLRGGDVPLHRKAQRAAALGDAAAAGELSDEETERLAWLAENLPRKGVKYPGLRPKEQR